MLCAAAVQGGMGFAQKRLRQGKERIRAYRRRFIRTTGGKGPHPVDAQIGKKGQGLILDHIGKGADNQKLGAPAFRRGPEPSRQDRRLRLL